MQSSYARHLTHLFQVRQEKPKEEIKNDKTATLSTSGILNKSSVTEDLKSEDYSPSEFNNVDWLTYLLHVDAELEHSLMVQYLYAAYSIGGPQVPKQYRELVKDWKEVILGIAKEEMGHFVSIQNVLKVTGAPLSFDRQTFPSPSHLYPFNFSLEKFTKASLAKYIYAESPDDWLKDRNKEKDPEMKKIKDEIAKLIKYDSQEDFGDPISVLFGEILKILADPNMIPDDIFQSETYPYQAKFNEWGRGYVKGARGSVEPEGIKKDEMAAYQGVPDVLVAPLTSRTDTIAAVKEIAEQGESATITDDELSHFERFLNIYKAWRKLPDDFDPSLNISDDPVIATDNSDCKNPQQNVICTPEAQLWAHLFNVRYRMLLTFLSHSFFLDDGFNKSGSHAPRGTIINATFGEMYNLRSITNVLVQIPIQEGSDVMASPPFLIPYTMDLPTGEKNRWRVHLNLLEASARLISNLEFYRDSSNNQVYLRSLKEADDKLMDIARKIIDSPAF